MKFVAQATGSLNFASEPLGWLDAATKSPWFWVILTVELATFIVWLEVLKRVTLSFAFSTTSMGYITVVLASWAVFGERVGFVEAIGVGLIVSGVYLIALGEVEVANAKRLTSPTQ
jgi:multidrug transporter EmrE-like cation transporter